MFRKGGNKIFRWGKYQRMTFFINYLMKSGWREIRNKGGKFCVFGKVLKKLCFF